MKSVDDRRAALRRRFPNWEPRTLDQWLDECAAQYDDRPLVITEKETLTYSKVSEQSRVLADALLALDVGPGDRVGMLMANYAEFVPFKIAIARLGATAIPFNYLYLEDELRYVLAQSRCSFLLTMTGFGQLDYLGMLDAIAPGWETRPNYGELRHVAVLSTDGRSRRGAKTYQDLLDLGSKNPGRASDFLKSPMDPSDMLYTSGSTGSPKGVLLTHDAVLRNAYASALTRAYDDARRILFSLPCYHAFGYIEGLLSATYVGGAVVMQTSFSAEGYFSGIERYRVDDILCVPTMAVALVESSNRNEYDLSSLSAVLCGASAAPLWLWEKAQALLGATEIMTGYGVTEGGGAMTFSLPEDPLIMASTTAGRPKLGGSASIEGTDNAVEYFTVDPVTGDPLPEGAEGELVSRGPTMMLRYFEKPEETSAALDDRGWLRSGDLGRVRPDGYLEVTGRSKEVYKSGGELVMPKEIEDLLASHDEISQAFAIGLRDERWGEVGCAVIVRSPGSQLSEEAVIEYCRRRLARFKVPKKVVFLSPAELPLTTTGKIQKFKLVDLVSGSNERLI